MTEQKKNTISQFLRAMNAVRSSRLAFGSLVLLVVLYTAALFADFIAPYGFDNEQRLFSYAPATKIHCVDTQGKWRGPFVYAITSHFDEFKRRIYQEDTAQVYRISFFARGDRYKFLGVLSSSRHLFGVEEGGRVYLWGADSRGRDLFSRILHGGRVSLSVGLIGVALSFLMGLFIGGIAGYYGGIVDSALMRLCEMIMMVPGFYLMLALRARIPPNVSTLQIYIWIVVIFSFLGWAGMARIIRGMTLSLKQRDYCLAAKALGFSDWYIIRKHILTHTFSYSIVAITLSIPGYILGESSLSFLGLGIQDPQPSWGNLLSDAMGIAQVQFHPWILLPGLFIFLTVISFNLIGDALRDAFDPMIQQGR